MGSLPSGELPLLQEILSSKPSPKSSRPWPQGWIIHLIIRSFLLLFSLAFPSPQPVLLYQGKNLIKRMPGRRLGKNHRRDHSEMQHNEVPWADFKRSVGLWSPKWWPHNQTIFFIILLGSKLCSCVCAGKVCWWEQSPPLPTTDCNNWAL